MRSIFALLLFGLAVSSALACVNTSYSRKEEKQITCTLTQLIAGEFPEHSSAFYENQIALNSAKLETDPADVEARNDYAVALLKLKRYDEAEAEFLKIERENPGRYKTHANLGVLYKKMGQYGKAAGHTEKALEIRPEGHLGLGDYYQRMLEWRAARAAEDPSVKGRNFLGVEYAAGPEATANSPLVNREHLMTLIKADRHFADAYQILGDVLYAKNDLQHAMRAYLMASSLMDDRERMTSSIGGRIELVEAKWRDKAEENSDYIFDPRWYMQIQDEFASAEEWLEGFKQLEARMLRDGNRDVDFAAVLAQMKARPNYANLGARYLEAGVYEGEIRRSGRLRHVFDIVFLLGLVGVGAVILIFIFRAFTRRASRP